MSVLAYFNQNRAPNLSELAARRFRRALLRDPGKSAKWGFSSAFQCPFESRSEARRDSRRFDWARSFSLLIHAAMWLGSAIEYGELPLVRGPISAMENPLVH
jgi:hypothetical protein